MQTIGLHQSSIQVARLYNLHVFDSPPIKIFTSVILIYLTCNSHELA